MSIETERIIRAFLEIASGGSDDVAALHDLLHPEYVGHYPDYRDTVGGRAAAASLADHRRRFPRRGHELHMLVATETAAACSYTMSLWHDAEYLGVPPTGKELRFWVSDCFRIVDGRIRERWHMKDKSAIASQLSTGS